MWYAIAYVIFSLVTLYVTLPVVIWEAGSVLFLCSLFFLSSASWLTAFSWLLIVGGIAAVNRVEAFRRFITDFIFNRAIQHIPKLSVTEAEALNAGDVWFEQGIFTGELDWDRVMDVKTALTEAEQAFLDNETETLCAMLNDWEITHAGDLSEPVWAFIKKQGFFGLVIDKAYGGKGFSARAHSEIVAKIATRCSSAAVTVMVPNSLGPGELLQHYGTTEQKKRYLPALAKGEEVPCFALTEPMAGSDATAIESEAIVVEKKVDGETILGLELTINKRWITLAPVATLIGLAVQLKDPHGLLKGKGHEGITCVLISRDTKNLEIGNRHLPAGQVFMNGTIRGHNMFVPISNIIGGQEKAGMGWKMLVECLSIGRAISLPALGAATAAVSYLTTSAYARIRRQFNVEIGRFEGIEARLAEIAGLSYLVNTTRLLTAAAVDVGKKPSVASAIAKHYNTEFSRIILNHAMDVHGGRTVVLGPNNYLAGPYQAIPISITVEGANIMSRNLLIFGQGSMACHPYLRDTFEALTEQDNVQFGALLWKHIPYFLRNFAKTVCTAWTGGWLISTPRGVLKREYQCLTRLSYAYAWIADLSLILLGGSLKRKERLSARLADGMSYLYMATAALRYAAESKQDPAVVCHARWAAAYCYYHAQQSLLALCRHFPNRAAGFLMRFCAFPFGQTMHYPSDKLDHMLAKIMSEPNTYRDMLRESIYLTGDPKEPIDKMEHAFHLIHTNAALYEKIRGIRLSDPQLLEEKLAALYQAGKLSEREISDLLLTENARWQAIQVDEFSKIPVGQHHEPVVS